MGREYGVSGSLVNEKYLGLKPGVSSSRLSSSLARVPRGRRRRHLQPLPSLSPSPSSPPPHPCRPRGGRRGFLPSSLQLPPPAALLPAAVDEGYRAQLGRLLSGAAVLYPRPEALHGVATSGGGAYRETAARHSRVAAARRGLRGAAGRRSGAAGGGQRLSGLVWPRSDG